MSRTASDIQRIQQGQETIPPTSVSQTKSSIFERLLASLDHIPSALSLTESLARLLQELHAVFPGFSLGLRISSSTTHPAVFLTVPPVNTSPQDLWKPETRIFPNYKHESQLPILPQSDCAYLHCASDSSNLDPNTLEHTARLCANVVSTAIHIITTQTALKNKDEEIERLQQALIQSDKLASLGEISAGLVHELINPLTSIIAYTAYLHQKAVRRNDDPEDVERLQRIANAADLILSFTRAIESYATPDHRLPEPVDISQTVDQALMFCNHLFDSRIRIRTELTPDLPRVRAIQSQLVQVIVNLVSNACQAMEPSGGNLTIQAIQEPSDRTVLLRFIDSGPGIDPSHLSRVFEPFFTTKYEKHGTGLGLSIVRRIIDRCGGTVSVESQLGHGAAFTVTLPEHDQ